MASRPWGVAQIPRRRASVPVAPGSLGTATFPHLLAVSLAALAPLLYVYLPRPPVSGSQFLVYPAMAGVLGLISLHLVRSHPFADARVLGWLVLLLLYSVVTGASFLANSSELRGTAPLELFRPVVLGVFLTYGFLVGVRAEERAVNRGLAFAAAAILAGQLVLAGTQLVGLPVFSFLYESDKARPFGLLLRVTGSMGNPNTFAWIVAQAAVVISLTGHRARRHLWILLATLLVLSSGSRSILLLFPLMLMAANVMRDPTSFRTYARYASLAIVLLGAFWIMIANLGDYFPYLAQLKSIASTGSLASVNSFAMRLQSWDAHFVDFSAVGTAAWLLGLGSRESTAVMDNDFLYVFFRLGLSGVVLHYTIVVGAMICFFRARRRLVAVIGAEYLLFALIFGLVSETLASWHLPLLLFLLLGLTLGLDARTNRRRVGGTVRPALASEAPRTVSP